MPAYNSNFVTPLAASVNTNAITGATATSSVAFIENRELLVVGGEIVMAGETLDIVEQVTGLIPLTINLELTTTAPAPVTPENPTGDGTVTVPYVPGVVVDSGTGTTTQTPTVNVATPTPVVTPPITGGVVVVPPIVVAPKPEVARMLETYLDAFSGSNVLAHKLSRSWSVNPDPNAEFICYESQNGGASFTQRKFNSAPISSYQIGTVMSGTNFVSLQIEKANLTALPDIYVTIGTVGGAITASSYKFTRPYLPVAIGYNGVRVVVLTEGNRIYSTADGVSWADDGPMSTAFPFNLGTTYNNGQLYSNTKGVSLQWLPGLAKWLITWLGGDTVYTTSVLSAHSGWVVGTGPVPTTILGVTTKYSLHTGYKIAELAGNLYSVGNKVVSQGTYTNSHSSAIMKSTNGGISWTSVKDMLNSNLYGGNGEDAVLDRIETFNGYLVAYTRGYNPRRYKSTDAGATWTSEATNLPYTDANKRLCTGSSVVAIVNLGVANDVYRYSTNGTVFDDCLITTVNTTTGAPVVPPVIVDPFASTVYAAIAFNKAPPVGKYYGITKQGVNTVVDYYEAFNGWRQDVVAVMELPYLGSFVAKSSNRNYSYFMQCNTYGLSLHPTGTRNAMHYIYGDYTFEFIGACDLETPYVRITNTESSVKLGSELYPTSSPFPTNSGLKVVTSYSGIAPIYTLDFNNWSPTPLVYYHYALVRKGLVVTLYRNGIPLCVVTQPLAYTVTGSFTIMAKYLAQLRYTEAARYSAAFTPPSTLLT